MQAGTQSKEKILEVCKLSVTFTTESQVVHAVEEVDIVIKRGQVTGLIGETGSGKTVTALAIMGLLPTKGVEITGKLFFNSQEYKWNQSGKKGIQRGVDIAMIFQDPVASFNPVKKIGSQIKTILKLRAKRNISKETLSVNDLLNDLDLTDHPRLLDAYPHQLSGGELQRLMVAMSLLQNPDVLIADEPTASLDDERMEQLLALLKRLAGKYNIGILLITHDITTIRSIATALYVMHRGRIVENGPTSEVLSHPQHAFTRLLIQSIPSLEDRVILLDEIPKGSEINKVSIDAYLLKLQKKKEVLNVQNLSVHYPLSDWRWDKNAVLKALEDCTFALHEGECLGVYGASGSGKSTLLATIVQGVHDYDGVISYQGENILELQGEKYVQYRQKVQYIFQNPHTSLDPYLKIGKSLSLCLAHVTPGQSKGYYEERVEQLLKEVELDSGIQHRYPHELSGGQKQRVCIARAISFKPEILLCDEIVSALDMTVQAKILKLLKTLQHKHALSIIFVTHDLGVIRSISDRVLRLDQGHSVSYGSVFDV